MKESISTDKKRGFLFITTATLMIILLFNLLIGYRIIYRRGERLEQIIDKVSTEDLRYSLETIIYSELRRIDEKINSGEYENGAEYIGYEASLKKVWFGDSNHRRSESGYSIVSMRINDRNRFYVYKVGEFVNYREIIRRELVSVREQLNIIGVELKKVISKEGSSEKIYILSRVNLYYNSGNKNPANPNREVLKDFEIGFEKES